MVTQEKIRSENLTWINIENPHLETLEALQQQFGFHDLDLEDCLSRTESPKIEEYPNYVFIVFHFPLKKVKDNHIVVEPLNVFLGNNFFITVSNGRLKRLEEFFETMKKKLRQKRSVFQKGSGFLLYTLINELFEIYDPHINHLSRSIREIEEDIFEGKVQKDRLYDIMTVKREIITLKRALLPHSSLLLSLEHLHKRFIDKKLELYFNDIGDKIARNQINLNSMDEIIDTLQSANESLTSHNTNRVMKILTIFSVTMLPLTFLTGLYGMNVVLPLANKENTFIVLSTVMIIILILTLGLFRMKRFL
ncbi:MAG: magnesium transporter CorA family protein [bacterium]|nr:magnesium transporter CorA family protein [bacterium]